MVVHRGKSTSEGQSMAMHVDAEDFRRVLLASRDFDKSVYRELRKSLRAAGGEILTDVRAAIGQIPSSGRSRRGLRASLQRGTRVAITTGGKSGRGAGIRITTSARGLPAKAFNKRSFRHLVFGREGTWTTQYGRPYFGVVIGGHAERMRQRVLKALDDAAEEMAREVEH